MSHGFKQITPTDHFSWHSAYLECYHRLFLPYREEECEVLEIGTDGGGGLRMYQDYFTKAKIVGMDISPTPDAVKNQPRIVHGQVDAYSTEGLLFTNAHCQNLKVAVDDGPHTLGSQEFFAKNYPALLSSDGIAIIEDIAEHAHLSILQSCVGPEFFTMGIDLTHHDERRFDNRLLVIFRR